VTPLIESALIESALIESALIESALIESALIESALRRIEPLRESARAHAHRASNGREMLCR